MKRKCLVLFILAILICVYSQFFSGCATKPAVAPGPTQEEIEAQKAAEPEEARYQEATEKASAEIFAVEAERASAEREAAEAAARARFEYDRRAAEESDEEYTLEEIAVTGARITRQNRVNIGPAIGSRTALKRNIYADGSVKGDMKLELSFENEGLGTELWIIEKTSSAIGEEYKTESPRLMCSCPGKEDVI